MPQHPLREALSDRERGVLDALSQACRTRMAAALARDGNGGGGPTRLFEKLVDDAPIELRPTDVVLWMELVTRAGPAYAEAWRREKDRARDRVERGRHRASDDLVGVSDAALRAAAEAAALFPFAFVGDAPLAGTRLSILGRRAEASLQWAVASGGLPSDVPVVTQVRDVLKGLADEPSDVPSGRGLLELVLLLTLADTLAVRAREALTHPERAAEGQNPGLQFDRLRRGLAAAPRLRAVLRLPDGSGGAIFDAYELPGYQLLRMADGA